MHFLKLHADGLGDEAKIERPMLLGELAGLQLSGEYGCAHSLIDKVVWMIEDDVMRCLGVASARNKNKRCRIY